MKAIIKNDWMPLLSEHFESEDYIRLRQFLINEYKTHTIYPGPFDIFNALHYTPYASARVVILGQDPYHGPSQAHGLSFSVLKGNKIPPSLVNIYKELHDDLGCTIPSHGYLKKWADQGVLMLNAVLTVRAGQANSHKGIGWENFTDNVIRLMNRKEKPVVFILWGANARAKKKLLDPKHCVIESAHPSPLSAHAGFFGSKPFGRCNEFLRSTGQEEIDWQIDE